MAEAREWSPVPDTMCHYPELLLFKSNFFILGSWRVMLPVGEKKSVHLWWKSNTSAWFALARLPEASMWVILSPFFLPFSDSRHLPKAPHISPKLYPSFCLLTLPPVLAVPPPPLGPATTLHTAETASQDFRKAFPDIQREKSTWLFDS